MLVYSTTVGTVYVNYIFFNGYIQVTQQRIFLDRRSHSDHRVKYFITLKGIVSRNFCTLFYFIG
jgi:hypothetical protein